MGWFDDQIKQRIKNDDNSFSNAFSQMSGVVMGKKAVPDGSDDRAVVMEAIGDILRFYNAKTPDVPDGIQDIKEILQFALRPYGIMQRTVDLNGQWYKDGIGALLCEDEDGSVVALIPRSTSGYTFTDRATGKKKTVNSKNAASFGDQAICFYKPFPLERMDSKSLLVYIKELLSVGDYVGITAATLAVSLIGLFTAYVNNLLFSTVIQSQSKSLLLSAAVFLIGVTVSGALINITKSIILSRISSKIKVPVESATMMRVLSLPGSFFKNYSSGDLASRIQSMSGLCTLLIDIILSSGLSAVMATIYIFQIFHYSPILALPSVAVLCVTVIFAVLCAVLQMKQSRRQLSAKAKENGLVFSLFSGIQKIRLSGSEKRAFAKWADIYTENLKAKYDPPKLLIFNGAISTLIAALGTVVIYYLAVVNGVDTAEYMTFNAAYGMVLGAFAQFTIMSLQIAEIKPTLEMVDPIFRTLPEVAQGKKVATRLRGAIELSSVSFRYTEDMPYVIDDLDLKIKAGQYVAIVGPTGCGKSTLMRLLLGFEAPQKGSIYYDNYDLQQTDLKSLRKNIGTVMQDGKLFAGDIYSNIVISAPELPLERAWEAAEMAGIAEDIRRMPMQMHTLISEGSGGISGGQRQRLMIARAIAPKPRILMLDEATSALDNITQKIVSDSLGKLKCTRIVIAHRLSTIKECDRILVLDKGKIIEDGTYDQLIAQNGFFAELINRQRVDV